MIRCQDGFFQTVFRSEQKVNNLVSFYKRHERHGEWENSDSRKKVESNSKIMGREIGTASALLGMLDDFYIFNRLLLSTTI